jgi:hypothetical protein
MVTIESEFDMDGTIKEDPFLDRYELSMLFTQTRQSIERNLQRQLAGMTCDEHDKEPVVTITGRYDTEREELDIQYHLDTCCKMFMLKVVQRMNHG